MDNSLFKEQNPIPTESDLQQFENKYGVQFPEEYRQFLLKHGGGIACDDYVVTFKSTDPQDKGHGAEPLAEIYSVLSDSEFQRLSYAIDDYRRELKYTDEVYVKPKEFIPIANNSFGDYYCIGISEPVLGEIYMHIHDFSGVNGVDEDARFRNFFFIA